MMHGATPRYLVDAHKLVLCQVFAFLVLALFTALCADTTWAASRLRMEVKQLREYRTLRTGFQPAVRSNGGNESVNDVVKIICLRSGVYIS